MNAHFVEAVRQHPIYAHYHMVLPECFDAVRNQNSIALISKKYFQNGDVECGQSVSATPLPMHTTPTHPHTFTLISIYRGLGLPPPSLSLGLLHCPVLSATIDARLPPRCVEQQCGSVDIAAKIATSVAHPMTCCPNLLPTAGERRPAVAGQACGRGPAAVHVQECARGGLHDRVLPR